MKYVKHSSSFCSFCLERVSEYCTNPSGKVICRSCVELVTKTFKEEERGETNEPD